MPIYEYRCAGCGAEFEKLVRSSDEPVCPKCESNKLEKKLSVFATSSTTAAPAMPAGCGGCAQMGGPGCSLNS